MYEEVQVTCGRGSTGRPAGCCSGAGAGHVHRPSHTQKGVRPRAPKSGGPRGWGGGRDAGGAACLDPFCRPGEGSALHWKGVWQAVEGVKPEWHDLTFSKRIVSGHLEIVKGCVGRGQGLK